MSSLPNQPKKTQSDAKPADPSSDQPASAPPEPEAEAEEGECGLCLFMKGGGCKDSFIDWENCVQEAEDIFQKCSQVYSRLKECMDSHSDYYEPILRAEKHVEEQAVIELEKQKQDSASQDNQNDCDLESNATLKPTEQAEKDQSNAKEANLSPTQPASETPKAKEEKEEAEDEGECGFCVFMKGGSCRDTFVDLENCIKEAEENKEDRFEKCSQVTSLLKQCMVSHSDYYKPILMFEKQMEEQAVIQLEKEKLDSATRNNQQEASSHSNQK